MKSNILLNTRQRKIIGLAQEYSYIEVQNMSKFFNVTEQTIRRDLIVLCQENYLKRTHGGAMHLSTHNAQYNKRKTVSLTQKKQIGKRIADMLPDNVSIILSIGTTTEHVAQSLLSHKNLKVITNNVNIANTMIQSGNNEVLVCGGTIRNHDSGIIGEEATAFIKQFRVDYAVISISGIDSDGSLVDFDKGEILTVKTILKHARTKILAVDHTKFERKAPILAGNITDINILVTDCSPPAEIVDICNQNNVDIIIA